MTVKTLKISDSEPKNILDSLIIIMSALEDSNYHTPLARLQELSGVKLQNFYGSTFDKVGVQLARDLGWDGVSCALKVIKEMKPEDQKGMATLLRSSGINITFDKTIDKVTV